MYLAPEPDERAEVVTRPLLGDDTPAESLCPTPRTDYGDYLPCGGGTVNPAVPGEQKIPTTYSNLRVRRFPGRSKSAVTLTYSPELG